MQIAKTMHTKLEAIMGKTVLTVTLNPSVDKTVTVERLIPYGLNRVIKSETDPGGKGINVSRVLHSFGIKTTAVGFIAGHTGKLLQNFLIHSHIDSNFTEIPGETRTNVKIFDQQAKKITEINESGCEVCSDDLLQFKKNFEDLCAETAVVVLTGSIPPGVPDNIYGEFIHIANEAGVQTILDADGEALKIGIKSKPFAVKPNLHELEGLVGRKLLSLNDIVYAGQKLILTGINTVIVSMGGDGAVVINKDEAYKTKPWTIQLKSATGAGDSMVAALAYSILQGLTLDEIARITTAAGTVTASKPGTQLCTKAEILKSARLVTLNRVKP